MFCFLSRPPLFVRRPKPTLVSFPCSNCARSEANCFVPGKGVDAAGMPLFILLSKSSQDQLWYRVDPKRTGVDWRATKDCTVSSVTNVRAALGQMIGHEAPLGEACASCKKGNGPFSSCRIVFLAGLGFQWSLSCACCQWSSAANKCTLREYLFGWFCLRSFSDVFQARSAILLMIPTMTIRLHSGCMTSFAASSLTASCSRPRTCSFMPMDLLVRARRRLVRRRDELLVLARLLLILLLHLPPRTRARVKLSRLPLVQPKPAVLLPLPPSPQRNVRLVTPLAARTRVVRRKSAPRIHPILPMLCTPRPAPVRLSTV